MTHEHNHESSHGSEHANCCGHMQWWRRNSLNALADRKPFALPGTKKRYAPDMTVRVHHVKLELVVDPIGKSLSGTCSSTIQPIAAPVSKVAFESTDLEIQSVTSGTDGSTLAFEITDTGFVVDLGKQLTSEDKALVVVKYRTLSPKLGVYFTGPNSSYSKKPYQVWTQSQDDDAHHWFPVVEADHPNHRMTSEVIATVPRGFTALSNGSLIDEQVNLAKPEEGLAETKTFHWLHNQPHVTYLMALVVGEFVKIEEKYGDLPVQAYVHPSLEERAREYFKGTADLVKLFSKLYRTEYPWKGKYAQVFVQDFIFGGMENTTITVMTDRILADAWTRDEARLSEVRLNAHELNHHWNGDLVTCRDWSHAWLNEGGATYGEVEAVENIWGIKERDYYAHGLAKTYFAEDRRYRRPIVCNTFREPIDLFDRHLYQKGGLVRHMLRYILGDEGYYASIARYYADNAYKPVETIDLIRAIETTTGKNLRPFFDQWVFGAGYPEYKVGYSWDEKQKLATVKVSQMQKIEGDTGLFSMPIEMAFDFADGSNKLITVTVEEKEHSFSFHLDSKPKMFRFDPSNWVLKTVELDVPKGMLIHQVGNDPTVMGRIYAAKALATKSGAGDDVVKVLEDAANSDFFWGVSVEAVNLLGTVGTPAAKKALSRLATVRNAKVRRSVVNALGNYEGKKVATLLADILTSGKEQSQFVLADAATALGRTKWKGALEVLKTASTMDSWNEIVRIGALNGLAELGHEAGTDVAADLASAGKPWHSRPAAIACLGKLASSAKTDKALKALHKLAESEEGSQFTLRMSIVGALGTANKAESLAVLNKLEKSSFDGRIKRHITETANNIKEATGKGAKSKAAAAAKVDQKALAERVEKLSTELAGVSSELKKLRRQGSKSKSKK
ncbi:MAG: M1 family metallopeptidase [Cyanobacteria bacterium SZAS LIN-3]|nr:M1 family metallopeptidase [Cyanobacteria bacterium SZAS LIN-3]MBS2007349.1 M1 family metallopeptidase [Cyanobacteria bacterium SZAS TMP-1]